MTKLFAEAVRLEGKPKSNLAFSPEPRRKQNKQAKTSLLV